MSKQDDFYQKFREKMRRWLKSKEGKEYKFSEYLMFAPDLFHLLIKLLADKRVPAKEKVKLAGAVAYFMSPVDLIPEGIVGPIGYVDDIALAAYVLNSVINNTSVDILMTHWAGDRDVLEVISEILKVADEMVGSGLWRKIKSMF